MKGPKTLLYVLEILIIVLGIYAVSVSVATTVNNKPFGTLKKHSNKLKEKVVTWFSDFENKHSENTDDNVTHTSLTFGIIIDKDVWGGAPALSKRVLVHPTSYVIIAHTATPMCETFKACSARVLNTQQFHVSSPPSCHSCPDIAYNFLIGGDGNAYVGRGWDAINAMGKNSIAIGFIGNYLYHNLTVQMIQMLKHLLTVGVEEGKLSENYKLIAHNQTYPTLGPGPHVYAVISKFSHFYPGRVIIE